MGDKTDDLSQFEAHVERQSRRVLFAEVSEGFAPSIIIYLFLIANITHLLNSAIADVECLMHILLYNIG